MQWTPLQLERYRRLLDSVVNVRIVQRNKLFGDDLDHFLCGHTSHVRCDRVKLARAVTTPVDTRKITTHCADVVCNETLQHVYISRI